jgi:hypothetical protein
MDRIFILIKFTVGLNLIRSLKLMFARISTLPMAAVLALAIGGTGHAFAGPVPAGWTCTGNCGTDGADGDVGLSPTGNTSYEYVTTSGGATGAGQLPNVGGTNGSSLMTPVFTANAGDPLQFYFNYVTSDGSSFADYAWAQLFDSSGDLIATMFTARTEPTGNTSPGQGLPTDDATLSPTTSQINANASNWSPLGASSGTCFAAGCGSTGWIESSYDIANAGSYYLEVGVTNFVDTAFDSGLAVDGVTVAGVAIPTDVPEPASMVLLSAGLGGIGMLRRRRHVSLSAS